MLSLPSPKHEAVEAPGIRHLGFEIVKSQSVPKDPATVSSRGSLSGTVLLITSPVNALPSHTVSVCIISYLCSNVHPTNSELDEFCHLRREFGTFFFDCAYFWISSIKMFCCAVQFFFPLSLSFILIYLFIFVIFTIVKESFSSIQHMMCIKTW